MALPRYPQLKKKMSKMLADYFEREVRKGLGPFQDVKRFTQHEGKTLIHNIMNDDKKSKELKYVEAKTEYRVAYDDVPTMGAEGVLKLLQEQAKDFGAQQTKHSFKVLHDTTEETGNVVNNGGKPFSIDSFFAVMEKIQI
jgi:ATP-dependent exoDNAse (exonuclease V) alpha subunit